MAHLEGTPTKPRVHNHPNNFYAPGTPKRRECWRIPRMAHSRRTFQVRQKKTLPSLLAYIIASTFFMRPVHPSAPSSGEFPLWRTWKVRLLNSAYIIAPTIFMRPVHPSAPSSGEYPVWRPVGVPSRCAKKDTSKPSRIHNRLNNFYAPGTPKCRECWRIPPMAPSRRTFQVRQKKKLPQAFPHTYSPQHFLRARYTKAPQVLENTLYGAQ